MIVMIKNILLYAFFILFIGLTYSCQKVDDRGYNMLYSVHSKNPITVSYINLNGMHTITQNNGVWSTSFNIPKDKYPGFIIDIEVVTKGDFYVIIYKNGYSHRVYRSKDYIQIIY